MGTALVDNNDVVGTARRNSIALLRGAAGSGSGFLGGQYPAQSIGDAVSLRKADRGNVRESFCVDGFTSAERPSIKVESWRVVVWTCIGSA